MPRSTQRPRQRNKRGKPRTDRVAATKARRRKPKRSSNRRVDGKDDGRPAKPQRLPLTPAERKARNRTVLLISMLALVNAYVFLWRGEGALAGISGAPAAVIGGGGGPLPPIADPPQQACTDDPVRIFAGLDELIHLESALTRGSTLRLALLQLGVDGTEIDLVETSLRPHLDLSLLGGSGAPVRIAVDRLGGVRALELELAEGRMIQACRDGAQADGFAVRTIEQPMRSDVEVIALQLGRDADLASAVRDAKEQPALARAIAAHLAHDVDLMTETRPGDAITVVVEKRWLGHGFHRYGAILALRFAGVAGRIEHFRYKPEGAAPGFFDARGQPVTRALLRSPVGYHHVAPEARAMLLPSLEVVEGRLGAVYRLPEGAPLVAIGDGIVVALDDDGDNGRYLDIELDDGTRVRYAHLLRTMGGLDVGSDVSQGQLVALAGHSGRTPHDRLRLELWQEVDDAPRTVDPMRLLAKGHGRAPRVGPEIPEDQRTRYEDDIAPRRRALRIASR